MRTAWIPKVCAYCKVGAAAGRGGVGGCASSAGSRPFLPAPDTQQHYNGGESADGQKRRKGARGRLGHELYMVSHFKQQRLSTHNNGRLCYGPNYRHGELAGDLYVMMKTVHGSFFSSPPPPHHSLQSREDLCRSRVSLHWREIVSVTGAGQGRRRRDKEERLEM